MTDISDERLAELRHIAEFSASKASALFELTLALRELQRRRAETDGVAPIARVTVEDGDRKTHVTSCVLYAPGLPPGRHDLYPVAGVRDAVENCTRCEHPMRYHFDDGNGAIRCRYVGDDCECGTLIEREPKP